MYSLLTLIFEWIGHLLIWLLQTLWRLPSRLLARRGTKVVYADAAHGEGRAMRDPQWRLSGKPDFVYTQDGHIVIEEQKSGRPREPRLGHVIQLGVYFLLALREYGQEPAFGLLTYENGSFRVENTPQLRSQVLQYTARLRAVESGSATAAPNAEEHRCSLCGFQSICPAWATQEVRGLAREHTGGNLIPLSRRRTLGR